MLSLCYDSIKIIFIDSYVVKKFFVTYQPTKKGGTHAPPMKLTTDCY
ncbi:hypothetical protein [Enterocloster phage PMBT24]|uniref:Uncharacterized protein n=1 Tax=Enterocloster phage PMBT24 TaxID=3025413 RepID=A0AAT9TRE4_9CAUD|nr:hypothetical protein [Enterocloster phage PMBT24]